MEQKITPAEVHVVLSKYMLADGYDLVVDPEKSNGCNLVDSKSGETYLDYFSFFASMPIGFNHSEMSSAEFINEIGKVALHKISNSDFYTTTMAEFVDTMAETAMPAYMKKMFFISGGALAVENALKTAFDWKVRKNFEKGCKEEKGTKIIHFKNAFHGRTGYTLSLTNTADPRKYKYFPKFDWPRFDTAPLRFPITDEVIKEVAAKEKSIISEIETYCKANADDIAALIIEPIQAEGGDNHFRNEFFQELRRLADTYEFLLIFDEVQTGGGITGKMWAHQHFEVEPDIICFGKKFQICGIMVGDRVLSVKNNCFEESSRINSTWGGSLVDMKRSTKYLEIMKKENLLGNATLLGNKIKEGLAKLVEKTGKISNVRGVGLFIAFDMESQSIRNKFLKMCMKEEKLIILPCGTLSVRLRPFLDIKEDAVSDGLARMEKILNKI